MGQHCACLNGEIGQHEVNADAVYIVASPRPLRPEEPANEVDTLDLSLSQHISTPLHSIKSAVPLSAPTDLHSFSMQNLTRISEVSESQTSFLQSMNTLLETPKTSKQAQSTWFQPMQLFNGAIYTGEWDSKWRRHGQGVEVMPDGSKYIGNFYKDQRHGKGQLTQPSGQSYEGYFQHGTACGYGQFIQADGSKYNGQFKNDLQHGQGIETYTNGSWYKGEFLQGRKEGRGTFTWSDGSVYTGQFKDNLQCGTGTMQWTSGKVYSGDWVCGHIHGTGCFQWPDGRQYVGHYINGKKEGTGTLTWPNGRVFEGEWKAGVQHGSGTITIISESGTSERKLGIWNQGALVKWI